MKDQPHEEHRKRLFGGKHHLERFVQGEEELLSPSFRKIGIIGTREPSDEGRELARKIAKICVEKKFIVVSGLAKGIDTEALKEAQRLGGENDCGFAIS